MKACPLCQKDDRSRSLKAFRFDPAVAIVRYNPVLEQNDWVEVSDKLMSLFTEPIDPHVKPPKKEEDNRVGSLYCGCFCFIAVLVFMGVFTYGNLEQPGSMLLFSGCCGVIGLFMFYLGIWEFLHPRQYFEKIETNYEKGLAAYNKVISQYEHTHAKWKRSFYCSRDGIVYDPESQDYCNPHQNEYLDYLTRDTQIQSE